jgi:hypothetical protein
MELGIEHRVTGAGSVQTCAYEGGPLGELAPVPEDIVLDEVEDRGRRQSDREDQGTRG